MSISNYLMGMDEHPTRKLSFQVFFPRYGDTHESLGELEKAVETQAIFHTVFLVLPNFHLCYHNFMEIRKAFSISY